MAGVLVGLVAAVGAIGASSPSSMPCATTLPAPSDVDRAYALLAEGMEQSLAGQFEQGVTSLAEAAKLAPADPKIAQAHDLLEDYVSRCRRSEDERAAEYADAVQRVGWAKQAQANLAALTEAGIQEDLHRAVRDVVTAVNRCGNGDALVDATRATYQQVKSDSLQALDDAIKALASADALLESDSSGHARTFHRVAASLGDKIRSYRAIWSAADVAETATRRAAARELRAAEEDLYSAMEDLNSLASDKPWREALSWALQAKAVAIPADNMTRQQWYIDLVKDAEQRGKEFVAAEQWPDALAAYVALRRLDEDNVTYQDMVEQIKQHVRVLRLYGKGNEPTATTLPTDPEPTWQEMVAGADAEMAEKAISQLDSYYVTAVDYAKLARGALSAVKVLAETDEAAGSFPLLADEEKRQAFVQDIDNQLRAIESRDRVDHLDLTLALNSVLRSSERTVKIPTEVLVVEFTDGLLDELDDFSSMIWPYDIADFQKQTMGHFFGVGIQIGKAPGEPLKVITPLADSPALKAGMKPGDLILAVDGRPTEDVGVDKLVRMITGERGTKVVLTIKRAGRAEPFDLKLTRQSINIATVRGWQSGPDGHWDYLLDPDNKIGYIRVTQFTDSTADDLHAVLEDLARKGVKSLILDLRINPGGLFRSATEVADEFLKRGRIVSTEGRQTRRQEVNANPSGDYTDGELIVLINEISASAAEIVSGAIKDLHRGIIVGERSYGKGSVQNVISIRRGRAVLKLTTAYYYLPSGRLLHRRNGQADWGVDPDVEVRMTPEQTRRWLSVRQKTDLLQDIDVAEIKSDLARQYDADVQLATAVLLLRLKQLQEAPQIVIPPATASLKSPQPVEQ